MPFTAAALTAFWTNDDQMGLIARTRTQMASEGLKVPADFEDFAEKEDLNALFKLLLKPAKTAGTTAGTLIEVASYAIPAKSQIRIDGARKMVLYYNLIGRRLEPADMMWPVIKNFVEQWKALMEKKKAIVGAPPKLSKDMQVYKWLEQFSQYLGSVIGVRNAPFTYLIRPDVLPAILAPREADQPYSEEYDSIEQEMKNRVRHDHTLAKSDNSKLFQMIEKSVQGHDVSATIAPYKRKEDGRGAFLAIKSQHAGKAVWDRVVREANSRLQTQTWSGLTSTTLLQHTALQRRAFIQLTEADEVGVPTEIPGPRQRVTYLLDSLKTDNPKMLAGVAAVEQDEHGKRVRFEDTVTYLLPFDPVAAKASKAKGLGVNVSTTEGKLAGGVAKGTTGVELRWHEPEKFAALSKEQKKELQVWNASQPKGGGRKRTNGKPFTPDKGRKRAKVGSAKATTKLFEAMTESHDAQMELMNVKLASLVSGGIPGMPPPPGATKVGATVGFNPAPYGPPPVFHQPIDLIAVQAEKARVAAVNFKNILKPPSKKTAP